MRTEPRPHVTYTEHLVKFGHVVFRHASGQTDKQTDLHTDMQIAIPLTRLRSNDCVLYVYDV